MNAAAAFTFDLTDDVRAAQRGDEPAFVRLIERYQNAVSAVALAIVRNASWSQDVAQDAFVSAWRHLKELRRPESFGPWLLQLVRKEALTQLRQNKRRARREDGFQTLQPVAAGDASAALDERTMYEKLYAALDDVPADARELLLLYYREGKSSEQVGRLLDLGAAAVRKRLERAREILRDRFDAIEAAAKKSAPVAGFALLVLAAMRASAAAAPVALTLTKFLTAKVALVAALVLLTLVGAFASFLPDPQPADDPKPTTRRVLVTALRPADAPAIVAREAMANPALARIDGRVRDHDGKPVKATISVTPEHGDAKHLDTAPDGTFSAEDLPPGVYDVAATREGWLAAPTEEGISVAAGASFFSELTFRQSQKARAELSDDLGRPLAGFVVMIGRPDGRHTQAVTNAEGVAELPDVIPLGQNRYAIFDAGADSEADRARGWPTSRILASDTLEHVAGAPLKIAMARFGQAQLEVRAVEGRSFRYVHFNRTESIGGWFPELSRVAELDATGALSLRLPAGTYHVALSDSATQQTWRHPLPVTVKADNLNSGMITTRAGTEHTLRISRADGTPANGAIVFNDVTSWPADDDGVVRGIDLDKKYPVTLHATLGGESAAIVLTSGDTKEVPVQLLRGGTLRGVASGVAAGETIIVSVAASFDPWFEPRPERRFSGPDFAITGVPAGEVVVSVTTDSGASGSAKVRVESGSEATVRVAITGGARIEGSLVVTNGPPPSPLPMVILDDREPRQTQSDGRFVFDNVAPGTHKLIVRAYGDPHAERTIDLAANATVRLDPIELDATKFYKPRVFVDP
ncbi:MAG: sigma-70 family RNA polymerase sigma factor [Deltaproteobacteria bacterium]|nr:sigma-70 family RNA polymerase sigma factor [Deltaproteobacteria bacterium]